MKLLLFVLMFFLIILTPFSSQIIKFSFNGGNYTMERVPKYKNLTGIERVGDNLATRPICNFYLTDVDPPPDSISKEKQKSKLKYFEKNLRFYNTSDDMIAFNIELEKNNVSCANYDDDFINSFLNSKKSVKFFQKRSKINYKFCEKLILGLRKDTCRKIQSVTSANERAFQYLYGYVYHLVEYLGYIKCSLSRWSLCDQFISEILYFLEHNRCKRTIHDINTCNKATRNLRRLFMSKERSYVNIYKYLSREFRNVNWNDTVEFNDSDIFPYLFDFPMKESQKLPKKLRDLQKSLKKHFRNKKYMRISKLQN